MPDVSVAVGLSIGIPLAVAVFIFVSFWYILQRRFKEEERRDRELEKEIYDETDGFNLDEVETWKMPPLKEELVVNEKASSTKDLVQGDSPCQDGKDSNVRYSKYYLPAYRKKVHSLYLERDTIDMHLKKDYGYIIPPVDSQVYQTQLKYKRISAYDQLLPFLNESDIVPSDKVAGMGIADITADSSPGKKRRVSNIFVQTLYSQDFGSYYPRQSSNSMVIDKSGRNKTKEGSGEMYQNVTKNVK